MATRTPLAHLLPKPKFKPSCKVQSFINITPKENRKKKAIPKGRREGMSGFLLKILPDEGGWRFLIKPAGLELDSPGRRLIFAFLFWFWSRSSSECRFLSRMYPWKRKRVGLWAIWRSPKYIMPVIWQPKKQPNTAKIGCYITCIM